MSRTLNGRELLGGVLRAARETLGDRSPEQVARAAGVSGRTIRRLEDGVYESRPRALTLDALASFYGLRAGFVRELGEWTELGDDDVRPRLLDLATELLGEDAFGEDALDEPVQLAMRVARKGGNGAVDAAWARTFDLLVVDEAHGVTAVEMKGGADGELLAVMRGFLKLDRRRRRLIADLIDELGAPPEAESEP
jgi:transcriptional regulator with XRE-family HTH domain